MSLHQPTHPCLHLEPLEDRFLLSAAALAAPPVNHTLMVPGQYAILPAEPAAKDATRPVTNQPVPLDHPAASTPPGPERDGDDYFPQREEGVAADAGDSPHAAALALVRSVAGHAEQQTGEPIRAASPAPGMPPTPAAEIRTLVPAEEVLVPHPLAGRPVGTLATSVAVAAEESSKLPPAPIVMVSAETGARQHAEAAAPTVDSFLLAFGLVPEAGDPLAGLLPLDVQALRRSADAFFARLANLIRGPEEDLSVRALVPWLLLGGAAAWEVVLLPRALRRSGSAADSLLLGTEDET